MSSTFVQRAGGFGRKLATAMILGLIGLVIGVSCVLLPPAIPFAIIGLAGVLLLWVMPDLQIVPEGWSRTMVPIFLFVFTCIPTYYAIILPGLPWVSIRRAVLIAWLVPLLILLAGSSATRRRVADRIAASPWIATSVLSFIAITYLTLPTAKSLSVSLNYVVLTSTLFWFLPFVGILACVSTYNGIVTIFSTVICAALINFFIGLVERLLQKPFLIYILPAYMRDQIFEANGILEYNLTQGHGLRGGVYRASSTFTTALTWGEDCAMVVPMCLHLVLYGKDLRLKTLGAIGTATCIASIYLTGSRGAYSSMAVGVAFYAFLWAIRSTLRSPERLIGKIGLTFSAMATAASALAILFVGRLHQLFLGGGGDQLSNQARALQWQLAKPKILARPITGYGGAAAGDVIGYMSSHNYPSVDGYYMNLLVDYGVLGFLTFFLIFIAAVATCGRLYLSSKSDVANVCNALGASMVAFTIYRMTLSQNDSLSLAFSLVGLTLVVVSLDRADGSKISKMPDRR